MTYMVEGRSGGCGGRVEGQNDVVEGGGWKWCRVEGQNDVVEGGSGGSGGCGGCGDLTCDLAIL